jgi:hypothetical protein
MKEHKSCGCKTCRAGAGTTYGQYVHRLVNKRIRQMVRHALRNNPEDVFFGQTKTPYTD